MRKLILVALLLSGCTDSDAPASEQPTPIDTSTAQPTQAERDAQLVSATEQIIAFLRGEVAFDSTAFADSVTLYMNPEGEVIQRALTRAELPDTANWSLRWGRGTYRIAPPPAPATMQTRAGRHFRCQEGDLATSMPQLAAQPHVGVRIDPPGADSCIQIWNSTFVFDTSAARPRLVGVVYDQFEW